MSKRDPTVIVGQMRDYAHEALAIAAGRSRADIENDRLRSLALVRLLEIIGEAANRVPPELRIKSPKIPWAQLIALRNRLIHGYDAVDFGILWQIIKEDLPKLADELNKLYDTLAT
jgi:uncharacterized protein with HEPN domain